MRKNFTLCTTLMLLALSTGGGITARAADGDKLTTVADAAGKSFTIKCARGYWYAYGKGNNSNVIAGSKGDLSSVNNNLDFKDLTDKSKFTIVEQTKSDNTKRYYLYSIDTKKWVITNGSYLGLADKPYEADSISFVASTGSTDYPTCIYFAGNQNNMYGISPAYSPDVYKYFGLADDGNRSVISTSGTLEDATYQSLKTSLNSSGTGFFTARTKSDAPIAATTDFNGQSGKAYLIHNISGSRNGYLHVDASGNITYESIPGDHADLTNFIFTTEESGGNLYLKSGDNRYLPVMTDTSQPVTNIANKIDGAGIATVAVKNGYKLSTLNFLISGHHMNVNPNGVVTTYDVENDPNGVWELTPVSISDNDFTTSTVTKAITNQNGTTSNVTLITSGKFRKGQTVYAAEDNFIPSGTATVTGAATTINVKEKLPFELSTDTDWHWYYLDIRENANSSNSRKWVALANENTPNIYTTFTDSNNSLWAFKGSQTDGIKVYNKSLGKDYTIKGDNSGQQPSMSTGDNNNNLIILKNNDGFVLKTSRHNNNCLHDYGGTLKFWNDNSAPTDEGSTFRVFPAKGFYTMKNYQNVAMGDTRYGYLGLSADAADNKALWGTDTEVSLNDVVYIAPTKAPNATAAEPLYMSMQLQGNFIQGVTESSQVTVGENTVSFKVAHPFVGYYAFGSAVSSTTPDNRTYLHTANSKQYQVVGWSTDEGPTSWQVSPVKTITMPANEVNGIFYATFYAPFAVKLTGAKAYTLTLSSDKSSATLNEVTLTDDNVLPAKSAVVIISEAATYTVEPVISDATAVESILTGVSLAESWSRHEKDLVFGQMNGQVGFYKWNTTNTLKNNRCYLSATKVNATATAKGVTISSGSTPTGINAANLLPAKNDGKIYNLQGQEVGQSYKGIVIKDGHKVIQ